MTSRGRADHTDRLENLIEWALGPDVLRPQDESRAVTLVTDTLAAALGASVEPEVQALAGAAQRLGGCGPSTVLATGRRTSSATAALVNGTAAVRLELDEGNQFAANHPSAHTLPAVLAVSEDVGASGADMLAASAAAYEVAVRVARGVHLRNSVHPFGTAMVCGAAVGVARLYGLDAGEATQALLVAAALTPASTQRAANTGATVRNAITGACAQVGVLAVELARTGTTGDDLALPTVFGEVLGTGYDDVHLDDDLGGTRYLTAGYLKVHACSRWNHAPVEATETLLVEHSFAPDEVEAIEVATYDPATRLDGQDAPSGFAGKHSIPYSVAARITLRDNGIEAYTDDAARHPTLRSLMRRVTVVEDATMTAAAPQVRAARVTVRLRDGRVLVATEDRAPGGPDHPYSTPTLQAKHGSLVRRALTDASAGDVLRWCTALPTATSVRGLDRAVAGRR